MPSSLKLSNNGVGRLSANIAAGATAISLTPGDGVKFPALGAGEWFPATLIRSDGTIEVIKVTARAGDALTATRAQENTAAVAFNAGDRIELRLTAGTFQSELARAEGTADAAKATADAALPKAGGTLGGTTMIGAINEAKAADLASAASPDIWSGNGNVRHITGTTAITGFSDAPQAGARRKLIFDGVVALTNSASLIIPGGNYTTTPGDIIDVVADTVSVFRIEITPAVRSEQAARVQGLKGNVNAATPLTKFDLSADKVVLQGVGGRPSMVVSNTAVLTCDLGLAGPAANGRDVAAPFAANSWINLFFIWNGATLATIASTASHTQGPVLPAGYTHWCYAATIRFGPSSSILACLYRGKMALYDGQTRVLAGGNTTVFAAVSCAAVVPPIALLARLTFQVDGDIGAAGNYGAVVHRPTGSTSANGLSGATYRQQVAGAQGTALATVDAVLGASQQIDYRVTGAFASGGAYIDVSGFTVPNGDS